MWNIIVKKSSEHEQYYSTPLVHYFNGGNNFDILLWRKTHGSIVYPVVLIMTRNILTV